MTPIDKIGGIGLEDCKILGEPGEIEVRGLVQEIRDELDVAVTSDTATHADTFQAHAHGSRHRNRRAHGLLHRRLSGNPGSGPYFGPMSARKKDSNVVLEI
jgi:hypothetical protein